MSFVQLEEETLYILFLFSSQSLGYQNQSIQERIIFLTLFSFSVIENSLRLRNMPSYQQKEKQLHEITIYK